MVAYHIVLPLVQTFMCLFENREDYNGWDDRDKSVHHCEVMWLNSRGDGRFVLQGISSEVEEEV